MLTNTESSVPWLPDNWQKLTLQASATCTNANVATRTPIFAILDSDDHLDGALRSSKCERHLKEILEGHSKQRQSARRDLTAGGGTHFKKR